MATIRLMLVDDHPVVREGLLTLLSEAPGILCVGEAGSGEEALRVAFEAQPDVVLMDLVLPGMDGIDATRALRAEHPRLQVVALTSFGDEKKVRSAIEAGAIGFLLKDVLKDELLRAIRNAAAGRPSLHPQAQGHLMHRVRKTEEPSPVETLTTREREILTLIARGRNNGAIAETLRLSRGTVKGHVSRVFQKLGVEDRTQAALLAVREGLVTLAQGSE
jgi:NarL family two-component system response regulator LiaR